MTVAFAIEEVERVARDVRRAAEAYVTSLGKNNPRLAGWCLVVSVVLRNALAVAGFSVELVGGRVYHEVGEFVAVTDHFWVAVEVVRTTLWEDRCAFVDCTATQLESLGLPGAAVLPPGDARRRSYDLVLDDVGPDVLCGDDWRHVEAIERLLGAEEAA